MFALFLSLILSADAKTPATTVQAAKTKVIRIGEYQPQPFTQEDSTSRAGVTVSMTMAMHGWGVENIPCSAIGNSGLIAILYVVTTEGLLPTMTVITNVQSPRTGRVTVISALDVNMDGTVDVFKTLDGTDLKDQLAWGQAIYDAGLLCFVPSPTAYY